MIKKICFILLFSMLLISCDDGNDGEVANGPLPQVFIFPGEQEERLISQETIIQDNCDGTAVTSQTVEKSHTVLYTLELGSEITVTADGSAGIPGVGKVGVGVEIAGHYQVGYGQSETISRAQTVSAAPDSHIQQTIQHFEIWETGEVLIVAGNVNQRFPYKFRRDFSIKPSELNNIACPGTATNIAPPDEITPSPTPQVSINEVASSPAPQVPTKQKTVVTQGGITETYTMNLENNEILVGHADRFKDIYGCVAYLVVGPGNFEFSLTSGLWDLWSNVPPEQYETLLVEQGNVLTNQYNCIPVKYVRCDSQGCQQ